MATSLDTLVGFANLLGSVRGGSQTQTTSGGTTTQTQQTNLNQTAIDRLVQQMMSGQGGQAAISGAARSSGLYDSTTEREQLNDLNARVAGEVATRTAPTVTTTETPAQTMTTEVPGTGLGGLLGPLAIASVGKPIIETLAGIGGSGGIAGLLGGGASSGIDLGTATAGPGLQSSLGSSLGSIGDFASTAFTSGLGGAASGGLTDILSGSLGGMGDFASTSFSSALDGAAGGGLGSILGGVPLGSMLSLFSNPEAINAGSLGAAAFTPFLAGMGPVGAALAPFMPLVGSLLGGISVVCTALEKRGLLDSAQYSQGQSYLQKLPYRTIRGYYVWGVPLAKKIDQGSKLAIAISLPFARQRTALLAGSPWYRNPIGLATKYIGEPLCYALGYILEQKNKLEKVYGSRYSN